MSGTVATMDRKSTESVPDFTRLHPLQTSWTMWYQESAKGKGGKVDWSQLLKKLMTFSTVEDFWRLYNYVPKPSEIGVGCDYSLFREGIEPAWEHPGNSKGGRWVFRIPNSGPRSMDDLWLSLLLSLIGEQYEDSEPDAICGVVISIRKSENRLALWTKNAQNVENTKKLGYVSSYKCSSYQGAWFAVLGMKRRVRHALGRITFSNVATHTA